MTPTPPPAPGLDQRPLTNTEVMRHLMDFGLDKQYCMARIEGLSGGQKCKLVLAAALWLRPHLMILDEPTNYLDLEALGAMMRAIDKFKGGLIVVSHNKEFIAEVSTHICMRELTHSHAHSQTLPNTHTCKHSPSLSHTHAHAQVCNEEWEVDNGKMIQTLGIEKPEAVKVRDGKSGGMVAGRGRERSQRHSTNRLSGTEESDTQFVGELFEKVPLPLDFRFFYLPCCCDTSRAPLAHPHALARILMLLPEGCGRLRQCQGPRRGLRRLAGNSLLPRLFPPLS
jgi:energy-coupling factor transporter ATP-binding protein EcfA2